MQADTYTIRVGTSYATSTVWVESSWPPLEEEEPQFYPLRRYLADRFPRPVPRIIEPRRGMTRAFGSPGRVTARESKHRWVDNAPQDAAY